jgi:hypothetical protein
MHGIMAEIKLHSSGQGRLGWTKIQPSHMLVCLKRPFEKGRKQGWTPLTLSSPLANFKNCHHLATWGAGGNRSFMASTSMDA